MLTIGIVLNVKLVPPPRLVGVIETALVEATLKSDTIPVVAPCVPEVTMVHEIVPPTRRGEGAVHDNVDALLGVPTTTKDGEPLRMVFVPNLTLMAKEVVLAVGVVEKINVVPPFDVVGVMVFEAVDEIAKSLDSPVVAPDAPETYIVQLTGTPARCGLPTAHDKVDAVVGVP